MIWCLVCVCIIKVWVGLTFFFVDDVLLFVGATVDQTKVVMDPLDEFCISSSMKVNVLKSKIMCY